jgi:hypothetical protein
MSIGYEPDDDGGPLGVGEAPVGAVDGGEV